MPYGESASAEVVIVTCVYYVGVMTAGSSRDTAPGASWAAKLAKFGGAPGKRAF